VMEKKLNLKRLYSFFEPLKVQKMVIWVFCDKMTKCYDVRGVNNYLDINLTSESSDSLLSSENEEVIEILRKTQQNLNYNYDEVSVLDNKIRLP
jgi:hypothetical protein